MSDSKMVSVPRELLDRATREFSGKPSWDALETIRMQATVELRALLPSAPSEDVRARGEPVAWIHPLYLKPNALGFEGSVNQLSSMQVPLYLHAQRETVMPERMGESTRGNGWNACLDELKRLNP